MSEFVLRDMTADGLSAYVARQLGTFFPDGRPVPVAALQPYMKDALARTQLCFSGIEKKKFRDGGRVMFNYLHPDHYAMFLYLLANTVSRRDRADPLAFRLFYLNKVLHGLDIYHDTELPEVFQFMHPLGTVLGHAKYGNFFCVYQGCSVGSDEDRVFPELGDHVVLYAGASVIGRSRIGNNVVIGAHSLILNTDIPDNKVVLAGYQRLNIRDNPRHVRERRFR
jgi:serine O-acetyltransferase